MGSITVRLDCGHSIATHTDDLLAQGWTFNEMINRQIKRSNGKTKVDKVIDALDNEYPLESNPGIYPGGRCVSCFAKSLASDLSKTATFLMGEV
jgi:hypothetical protein